MHYIYFLIDNVKFVQVFILVLWDILVTCFFYLFPLKIKTNVYTYLWLTALKGAAPMN